MLMYSFGRFALAGLEEGLPKKDVEKDIVGDEGRPNLLHYNLVNTTKKGGEDGAEFERKCS